MMWHWRRRSPGLVPDVRLLGQDLVIFSTLGGRDKGYVRTGQTVSKFRVGFKVLAVRDHGRAQMATGKLLLLVVALGAFR